MENAYKMLDKYLCRIETLQRIAKKLEYDMQCCASEEGIASAADDIAEIQDQIYSVSHDKKYTDILCALFADPSSLSGIEKLTVEYWHDIYEKDKNITPEAEAHFNRAVSKAFDCWLRAKKAKDFSLFRDSLSEVIKLKKEEIAGRDRSFKSNYDACLDDFDKGNTVEKSDAFFEKIKKELVPLIRERAESAKKADMNFCFRKTTEEQQKKASEIIMNYEGLRRSALSFMPTEHPFTENFGPGDVRITTHFYEDNFMSNIYSTLHEGGHALFMMYLPQDVYAHHLGEAPTSSMHECISRFYENIIGRSEAFCGYFLPVIKTCAPGVFDNVDEKMLYSAVSLCKPDFIRMEADELTYCVHILIRYEIEKAFMNSEITVDEIPALWNEKYREYLGLEVKSDDLGVLQDVHWTDSYGYFPCYALGSAFGAQILHSMNRDFDVFKEVGSGSLAKITGWMKERAFTSDAALTSDEWLEKVTGEKFNSSYFIDYLKDKYSE